MTNPTTAQRPAVAGNGKLEERARALGQDMGEALRAVIEAIPGGPHTPTPLSRRLGMSRVITSKLLNAIARPDPYDVLQQIPGPESLRALTQAATGLGVTGALIARANDTIERFSTLIRDDFGTRGALNAAISPQRPDLQKRFELSSRYQVYKGMTEVLGVEADTWLNTMFFAPAGDRDDLVAVTTIHGALGMRRLRPDVNVYFTFGPPHHEPGQQPDQADSPIGLQEFYTNDPAPLETSFADGQLVHRLAHDELGRRSVVDMLAVSHNPHSSRRYASPERPRGGAVIFTDVPVKTLIIDILIHDDIFPGADPELIVYNPGGRGPANPADRKRDIDRIPVTETIEMLGKRADRFAVPEVPRYAEMVERVSTITGYEPGAFRLFRLRMAYPIHGFQFVMAFSAPPAPQTAG